MNEQLVSPHHSADVSKYRWYVCNHDGHIGRSVVKPNGNRSPEYLHQYVWRIEHGFLPDGLTIDHINRDPADNRIENLRPATPRLQGLNSNRRGGSDLPRGVDRAGRRYSARIRDAGGVVRRIGTFDTVAEAEAAYQSALADAIAEEEQKSWEMFQKQKEERNR